MLLLLPAIALQVLSTMAFRLAALPVRVPPPAMCDTENEDAGSTTCKFGTKEYWDGMYEGDGMAVTEDGLSAAVYSWYCGWRELEPFWREIVPDESARVLVPGVGNDATVVGLYDGGYECLTAFDYSAAAVTRATELFGARAIELACADATDLPYAERSFDAVLDKGALDAIGIASDDALRAATAELARCIVPGGVVVSVSRALEESTVLGAFQAAQWNVEHDGGLYLAESGAVSTDLAASIYVWRRR